MKSSTFKWKYASSDKFTIVAITHEATSAGGEEDNLRNPELVRGIESEAHHPIGNYAANTRAIGRLIQVLDQVQEWRQTILSKGVAELRNILGGILVGKREPVGDGPELEIGQARNGFGPPGPNEAVVVELGVDEGDEEAPGMQ